MLIPTVAQYSACILPAHPTGSDLSRLIEPYQALIVAQLAAILDRTGRSRPPARGPGSTKRFRTALHDLARHGRPPAVEPGSRRPAWA